MDVSVSPGVVDVRLSRRNLLALLAKLDRYPRESLCMLERECESAILVVRAEEDESHYRGRRPGLMHPSTEEQLQPWNWFQLARTTNDVEQTRAVLRELAEELYRVSPAAFDEAAREMRALLDHRTQQRD